MQEAQKRAAAFYERLRRRDTPPGGSLPKLSFRFFDTLTWQQYLAASADAVTAKIAFLQSLLLKLHLLNEVDPQPEPKKVSRSSESVRSQPDPSSPAATLLRNAVIFAALDTAEERHAYFAADQTAENYMLSDGALMQIVRDTGICPWVDICCDVTGSNALAPFFYSAAEDCRKQNLDGIAVLCNPPFKDF